jgi:hypothetical protein
MKGKISPQRHKGHGEGKLGQSFFPLPGFSISVADWIVIRVYSRPFVVDSFISVYLRLSAVSSPRLWGGSVLGIVV